MAAAPALGCSAELDGETLPLPSWVSAVTLGLGGQVVLMMRSQQWEAVQVTEGWVTSSIARL